MISIPLSHVQREFLKKVQHMNLDQTCTFTHRWRYLVDDVIYLNSYSSRDIECLNEVGNKYKEWKQKTHN